MSSSHKHTAIPESGETYRVKTKSRHAVKHHGSDFVGADDETPSGVAMRVNNPDRSPLSIDG
jgi:hypothetical protein